MVHAPYTSELAGSLAAELLERFERYVRIDTQSAYEHDGWPSTPGQLELGRLLVAELRELGVEDAGLDDEGFVFATLQGTVPGDGAPVVGFLAHIDTSPDAPGAGVEPIVHRDYDGRTIELPRGGTRLDPARMPELTGKRGHDIVTASGDTLLGADDKAGVAEIMTAVAHLARHPELPRATLRIGFTPDEEIGEGARRFDVERFGAVCAYTLDGSELGEIQDESFSAKGAVVRVRGAEVHPGDAAGKMVNAVRLASRIVCALPADHLSPETSSGRQGYIHPHELRAGVGGAELTLLLRDFDDEALEGHAELLRRTAHEIVSDEPPASVDVEIREQYRNMRHWLAARPEIVAAAEAALRAEGIEPIREPIRGGTDGSILTERGLPTPNLFTGGHEFHSPREWASLNDMAAAAATVVRLAGVWARGGGGR